MKNFFCLLAMLGLMINTFGQQASYQYANPQQVSPEQIALWKKKSRTNLIIALSMAAVGTAMVIGGFVSEANSDPFQEDTPGLTVAAIGVLIDLGSIPFTVMSGVYRKKAKAASVALSTVPMPSAPLASNWQMKAMPALTLSIPLGR